MVTGESFDPQALAALLHAGGRTPVLLYPAAPGVAAPDSSALEAPSALRLVVLDGTWRKNRKMLHLNPLLQTLPRLALRAMPASQYSIRKAHAPDQLSTLEAACHALTQLEGPRFEQIVDGFVGWVRGHRTHPSRSTAARASTTAGPTKTTRPPPSQPRSPTNIARIMLPCHPVSVSTQNAFDGKIPIRC